LFPLREEIDSKPPLKRYQVILRLLRKEPLQQMERASHLMCVRNELVHYKSRFGEEMTDPSPQALFNKLARLRLEKPAFIRSSQKFFPHQCLSASFSSWAVQTSAAFLNDFYKNLEVRSVLEAYADRLNVPAPRKAAKA